MELHEAVESIALIFVGSDPRRSLLAIAPPMNSLNIIRVIVSPGASHASRTYMIWNDVAVVGELGTTKSAFAVMGGYLSVEQLPHFRVRAEFAVSPRVLCILDSPNAELPGAFHFWDRLPPAAG